VEQGSTYGDIVVAITHTFRLQSLKRRQVGSQGRFKGLD